MRLRAAVPVIALLCTAPAALLLAPATSAKPKPRPDLVLLNSDLAGSKHFAFAGETASIVVRDLVKNTGRAVAGKSKIELTLSHGPEKFSGITRTVGKLSPGEKSKGTSTADIHIPSNAKLGAYEVHLCVDAREDVKEDDEVNNCDHRGQFYIGQRKWSGSFSGSDDDNATAWSTKDAVFKFERYVAPGEFFYEITAATVNFTTSGLDSNSCNNTGSGIETKPVGQLYLRYQDHDYSAGVGNKPAFSYPIFFNCGGGTLMTQGPKAGEDPLEFVNKPLGFGVDTLTGVYTSRGLHPRDYIWKLH
ncbi:MAG: CARDB domain-containing protein [Solirubrobacterales bacterium]